MLPCKYVNYQPRPLLPCLYCLQSLFTVVAELTLLLLWKDCSQWVVLWNQLG